MRALGTAPRPAEWHGQTAPEPEKPPAPAQEPARPPPARYARVVERDPEGRATKIHLPGPAASGNKTPLFGPTRGGYNVWVADVEPDGTLKSDGSRSDLLKMLTPGTRLVASVDATGRVIAVAAISGKRRHKR
jgi:hypothetical protein